MAEARWARHVKGEAAGRSMAVPGIGVHSMSNANLEELLLETMSCSLSFQPYGEQTRQNVDAELPVNHEIPEITAPPRLL
jgi:hypothetical protein